MHISDAVDQREKQTQVIADPFQVNRIETPIEVRASSERQVPAKNVDRVSLSRDDLLDLLKRRNSTEPQLLTGAVQNPVPNDARIDLTGHPLHRRANIVKVALSRRGLHRVDKLIEPSSVVRATLRAGEDHPTAERCSALLALS